MSKSKYIISEQEVLAKEVKVLAAAIEPLLVHHTKAAALIVMLSIATLIQAPDIDVDALQNIVSDVSKRIALLIENADPDAPSTVN